MARHTCVVTGELVNGDNELGTGLAKNINDIITGKTFVGMTADKQGQHTAVILIYDD